MCPRFPTKTNSARERGLRLHLLAEQPAEALVAKPHVDGRKRDYATALRPNSIWNPAGRRGAPSNLSLLCKNNCRSSARIVDVDQGPSKPSMHACRPSPTTKRDAGIANGAARVAILVLDPHKGALLASSDDAPGQPIVPGSTLKPLAVAVALDADLITPEQRFDCANGSRNYGSLVLRGGRSRAGDGRRLRGEAETFESCASRVFVQDC